VLENNYYSQITSGTCYNKFRLALFCRIKLRAVHTGDYRRLSPKTATVAEFRDCHRKRRLTPKSATVASPKALSTLETVVADFGDSRRIRRQA